MNAFLHECGIHVDQHVDDTEGERSVDCAHRAEHVDAANHRQTREPGVQPALHLAVDCRVNQPARRHLSNTFVQNQVIYSVLRIHDTLVWIRTRGSMPLTNESGTCYFRH